MILTFRSEYIAVNNLAFEWAESYDQQDWARLKAILAPAIRLDFRALHGALQENITPDQYIAIHADPKVIGDPKVKTQHLIGSSRWGKVEEDGTVRVAHQVRVTHQRYTDETLKEVVSKGTGDGVIHHTYKKFGEEWKITGNAPAMGWTEDDLFRTMNPDAPTDK